MTHDVSNPQPASRWGRRLLGSFLLLLGGVGTLAGLAGMVSVWVLIHRIEQPVDALFQEVTSISTRLEQGAGEVTGRIQLARDASDALIQKIRDSLAEVLRETALASPAVEHLKTEVQAIRQRIEDWKTFAETAAELVRQFMHLADAVLSVFHADLVAGDDMQSALDRGREQLGEALGVLQEIETVMNSLGSGSLVEEAAITRLDALFVRVDGSLARLQQHSTRFAAGAEKLELEAAGLHRRFRRGLRTMAGVATLLLIWQSAAQACLAMVGWRVVRSGGSMCRGGA